MDIYQPRNILCFDDKYHVWSSLVRHPLPEDGQLSSVYIICNLEHLKLEVSRILRQVGFWEPPQCDLRATD